MKLDAKKKKLLIVGAIVVGLILLLGVRGKTRASQVSSSDEDTPQDVSDFDYGTYNVPYVIGGGSTYNFGDITIGGSSGSNNGSGNNNDDLATKICGCMNPCGTPAPILERLAFVSPVQHSYSVPPSLVQYQYVPNPVLTNIIFTGN